MPDHEDEYAPLDSEALRPGIEAIRRLHTSFRKGELLLIASGPNKGHSSLVRFLKERPEQMFRPINWSDAEDIKFDTEATWAPAKYEQSKSRIMRQDVKSRVIVNAIVISRSSRRMREGVFVTFKAGRVVRKKHPAQVRQLVLEASVRAQLMEKARVLQEKGIFK